MTNTYKFDTINDNEREILKAFKCEETKLATMKAFDVFNEKTIIDFLTCEQVKKMIEMCLNKKFTENTITFIEQLFYDRCYNK